MNATRKNDGMKIYRGYAIVRCTFRREAVWIVYAAANGGLAIPLVEHGRCPSLASAKTRVDWLHAYGDT